MKKLDIGVVVTTLIIVTISCSLAFFAARVVGEPKDINLVAKNVAITFNDTSIIANGVVSPGWNTTKTFTITNNSKEEYKYNISIKDLINTFVTNGYLQYKITSTNNGYSMTDYVDVPKSSTATDTILAKNVSIAVNVTQTYTIEFRYVNDEDVDQGDDMGKVLKGTLFITEGTEDIYAGYEEGTLGYQIMGDNPTRSTRSNDNNGTNDFATPLTTTTTGTLFTSTESITGITDTPKEVYYYAGNTTNNWVKFGRYQNDLVAYRGYYNSTDTTDYKEYSTMSDCTAASSYNVNCTEIKYGSAGDDIYWRIIRTNHDSSIRLLYVGTSHDTTSGNIRTSAFNTSYDSPKYVGYKYGEDTSLDTIRNNTTDSTIKTVIDNWYSQNMTSYTKYLSTTAVYCNDRNLHSDNTYSTGKFSDFNYSSYERLVTNKTPTYNCTDIRDAFSVDNTSAKLDYPISLMTADEITLAGGTPWYANMSTPYAWFISNSAGTQVSTDRWWSLSPNSWAIGANVWYWASDSFYLSDSRVDHTYSVRPALSLKSCVKYASGDGSANAPYTIEETASGC